MTKQIILPSGTYLFIPVMRGTKTAYKKGWSFIATTEGITVAQIRKILVAENEYQGEGEAGDEIIRQQWNGTKDKHSIEGNCAILKLESGKG